MATQTPTAAAKSRRVGFGADRPAALRIASESRLARVAAWPSKRYLLRQSFPSWLTSLLVHLIAFVIMALVYSRVPLNANTNFISLSPTRELLQLDELRPLDELVPVDNRVLDFSTSMSEAAANTTDADEPPQITLAENVSAAPIRVERSDLGHEAMPHDALLSEVAALPGEPLAGRGAHRRGQMLEKYGGTAGSERAVAMALKWFANHQRQDGSWSLDHRDGPCQGRCSQHGAMQHCFTGGTALALLPFLGAGQTHQHGQYKERVQAGLNYLLKSQGRPNGSLVSGGGSLYSHGLASIVLCEAYAMTQDRSLKGPAQAALRYIVYAQDRGGGGWRYLPRQPGDTSVVGWQLMALKSGHMGQLTVPTSTVRGVSRYLNSVQADGGAVYGYIGPTSVKLSMTSVGLLCRMYLGWDQENPALLRGVKLLGDHGPAPNEEHTKFHMYYNYYATQVMRHHSGEPWQLWNEVMREMLVRRQKTTGHEAGSWDIPEVSGAGPHDTENGGRLYYTSLATMILEVYYRHMPIYGEEVIEDEFPL